MSENQYLVVFCSCPDVDSAGRLADTLVEERMAACVTHLPGATSVYRWEGAVHRDAEVLLIIKTTAERLVNLTARIEALHPYEVPDVLAVPVAGGAERYLAWLGQTVS